MSELRPVTGAPSGMDRHVGRFIALVAVLLIVAIAKPWGSGGPPPLAAAPTPTPSPTAIPSLVPLKFDFLTFGTNEPPPGWEIWPAGNLASFYFAMRIQMTTQGNGPSPSAMPSPTPLPVPGANDADVPAGWPTVRIPFGSTLDLIGINHPIGYTVAIEGLAALGQEAGVQAVQGDSPWPGHFLTIGVVGSGGGVRMLPWPPGRYRLDLRIEPGSLRRSMEVDVERSPDGSQPSIGPGPSASPATP
jgi:hypothetical protein